jgi:hypothetical protein
MVMEREMQAQRPAGSGGAGPEGSGSDETQVNARNILAAADRILDSIRPLNAEDYLQQNRQRGGE